MRKLSPRTGLRPNVMVLLTLAHFPGPAGENEFKIVEAPDEWAYSVIGCASDGCAFTLCGIATARKRTAVSHRSNIFLKTYPALDGCNSFSEKGISVYEIKEILSINRD